ncbi:uncharacterized protein LOC130444521 [Diorhabda sublineata]|uniref:uncharacterized protein LOC130444521 n=1 Tax=Diorhabda sublineata TaxID=1163346 RepID=UPI0024E0DE33|nr:uncharacterized protein LOC130444521 [Diorhabda sublineata]XP_056635682.1 uncharacterized protein LOC130444521 [Diorhabda sublineata]XP_056635683.1 uncharacterized protein LOC130444521 [Diorhabda sublineata]XP_056635684.1 uncharacterized protein LOC130444521 [Diorhabda sublineata]
MGNQRKTSVWKHLDEVHEENKIIGKCKYCDQRYANNATRMKKHLCACKKCPERIKCILQKLVQHKTGETSCGRNVLQISHPVHLAANLLDPRYCGQNLSKDDLMPAIEAIIEVAKNTPGINEVTVMTDIAEYKAKQKLWSKDIIWKAACKISPTTWWKGYCSTRELSRVAVRILNIPPTAASCERNWKAFSNIKTKKRNRLTDERTAKLVSVSQNLHLLSDDNVMFLNSNYDHDLLNENMDADFSPSCSSDSDLSHFVLSNSESALES